MTTYDNSGALWRNDRKEQPNHPDAKGQATIDGVEYWVSAWRKKGKDGKADWQSLSFKRKDEAARPDPKPQMAQSAAAELDDEIPF